MAVRVAADQQPLTVDNGDYRNRLGVPVVDVAAGRRHPAHGPGALVEGVVAVARRSLRAPTAVDHVQDDLVLVDDRGSGTAAVALEAAVLLLERARPDDLAVAVEAEEEAADELGVDVAGLRVPGERGPAHPVHRHGSQVEVVAVLPDRLAGFGVEGRDHRLLVDAGSGPAVDVDPAAHHDGRRAGDEVLPPDQVLAVRTPGVDQAGRGRVTVLVGTPPGGPFIRLGRQGGEARGQDPERREALAHAGWFRGLVAGGGPDRVAHTVQSPDRSTQWPAVAGRQ